MVSGVKVRQVRFGRGVMMSRLYAFRVRPDAELFYHPRANIVRYPQRRLLPHQLSVHTVSRDQLRVGAHLGDAARIQHENPVGSDDARKPVRDYQRRPVLHQPVQRGLDDGFVLRVHARKRLVQQQDRRVLEQRASNRQPLPLPAGQPNGALSDNGIVPGRQMRDELVRVRGVRGVFQLLMSGVRLAEPQIIRHSAVEQVRVLRNHRYAVAQGVQRKFAGVAPAELYDAGLRIVEPVHQPDQRGLPRAACADYAQRLPFSKIERHVIERRPVSAVVPERNRFERNLRAQVRRRARPGGVHHSNLLVQDAEDALRRGQHTHTLVVQVRQLSHRPEHFYAEHQNDKQRPELHVSVRHSDRSNGERDSRTDRHEEDRCAAGGSVRGDHAHSAAVQTVGALRERSPPSLALSERLERSQPLHAVQKVRAQLTVRLAPPVAADPVPVVEHRRYYQRQRGERQEDERDWNVQRNHVGEYGDRADRAYEYLRQVLPEERLQFFDALDQRENHVARAVAVEVSGPKSQRVVIDIAPQLDLDAVRSVVRHGILPVLEQAADHDQRCDDAEREEESIEARLPGQHAVDHDARNSQPRYARAHRRQSQRSREQNLQSHPAR